MVKVEGIEKSFPGKKVLKGVSFEAAEGSIYGLIGKNGAGKTTLMKILTGLLNSDGGSFSVPGGESGQKVGYLPDLPEFYDYLTTDEYLDFLLFDKNPIRREKLLGIVELSAKQRIGTMSRGMRQRLGIAAVLASDPDVVLLDEPTSALDPEGRSEVRKILLDLKKQNKTVILSTHILADMDSICDKAGFLHGGVIAREVDLKDGSDESGAWIIRFEHDADLSFLSGLNVQRSVADPLMIRIGFDGEDENEQQRALAGLSKINSRIVTIKNEVKTLDEIFREVCL
ncbi:MAG: ABC transporter ATP-binding protein [Lachnospiraceae bacterium]|nr:ABC transporter ATP-binding protein [Lachnospiraceae bacterium]